MEGLSVHEIVLVQLSRKFVASGKNGSCGVQLTTDVEVVIGAMVLGAFG